MRKGIGPRGLGVSPLKQAKEVKVKDVPGIVADTAENVAGKVVDGAKDLVNKIGNITLSTPEGQKRRAERKKKRLENRAEKANERLNKQWNKADAKTK
jgi:hypothetical protein